MYMDNVFRIHSPLDGLLGWIIPLLLWGEQQQAWTCECLCDKIQRSALIVPPSSDVTNRFRVESFRLAQINKCFAVLSAGSKWSHVHLTEWGLRYAILESTLIFNYLYNIWMIVCHGNRDVHLSEEVFLNMADTCTYP